MNQTVKEIEKKIIDGKQVIVSIIWRCYGCRKIHETEEEASNCQCIDYTKINNEALKNGY